MPRLTSYREDLATREGWLKADDVSNKFIHDTLPTNTQIFGMTEVANILTTRTVNTLVDWSSPFGRARHDVHANQVSSQAHAELVAQMREVQKKFEEDNLNTPSFRYIHLLPSNIDISISI